MPKVQIVATYKRDGEIRENYLYTGEKVEVAKQIVTNFTNNAIIRGYKEINRAFEDNKVTLYKRVDDIITLEIEVE